MAARVDSVTALRNLRTVLEMQNTVEPPRADFCTAENIGEAISTLSEELESLGISTPIINDVDSVSSESTKKVCVNLINASWDMVHIHRRLMRRHEEVKDAQHKIIHDNANLTNHVKRLKESLAKKQHGLCELQERERRLKVESAELSRELKREKEETIKLKKQSLSKDTQHAHELRRIQQSGHKLREQLQKSAGTYMPKDKVSQKLQADNEKKLRLYEQTIHRLEENNGLMLIEINELRETLDLHTAGIELQVEASGVWDKTERQNSHSMDALRELRESLSQFAFLESEPESSTATVSKQSAKRHSNQTIVKPRRGRKKKRKHQEQELGDEHRDSTDGVLYDEYEEDEVAIQQAPPKRKRKPDPSELLREWVEAQSAPESVKGKKITKKTMKDEERSRAAAASEEANKINYAESDKEKSKRQEERNQLIQDVQEEIRLEKYNTERQIQQEEEQASMRQVQLEETWFALNSMTKDFLDYSLKSMEEDDWLRYLTCDGLPDPAVVSDLNTFMFLWNLDDEKASMTTLKRKYEVVTYLLDRLDSIIDFSIINSPSYIEECKTNRQLFRDKMQFWIDLASYRLLRQIERDMVREDLKNARYINEANELICCVWALIRLPVSIKQVSERERRNIEVSFKEMDLAVKMPIDIDCYCMAIRGLWVQHDHYSDQAPSFQLPELPNEYQTNMDLFEYCQEEYETRLRIREEQLEGRRLRLEEKKATVDKLMKSLLTDKKAKKTPPVTASRAKKDFELEPEPLPYLPTPDEIILQRESEIRKEVRKLLFTRCEKTEVNLRKYAILGGIYHIDLIYQPPQPKDMRRNIFLTTLQLPKGLEFVPFSKPYKAPPPAPDHERTPEVIEAEMKALEADMENLALVTLKLPATVLWFEPPLVAHWIPERKIWSTQDVHDIKYNDEKQIITFRTGRLGIHGLAAFRLINLPYQSWELKPETGKNVKGARGIVLSITAAIVQAEFIIREDLVCLNTLIGGATTALQELVGKYMKLHLLIQKMRAGGCDLFPDRDAFSYVKGLPVKHSITEKHLQACMGLLCSAYNFAWSRWNAMVAPRQIVIQSKELHGCVAKQQSNMMLLVTPLQTSAVQCTEVSPEFSDQPADGDEAIFFADIYHLALRNAGIKSRLLMKAVSFQLANTVTKLLEATNVISMSS